MLRSSLSVVLLAFALQTAQAQVHGVPASVTSPTTNANGQVVLHGVPSSVTSPAPAPITSDQVRFRGIPHQHVPFRSPHGRPHKFVAVPVFYPVYDYPADSSRPGTCSRPAPAVDSGIEQRDNSPATVFIFKDGHKIETHSYAIVGQTLFDFTSKPLKKLQIADLDVDATRKANDDLGISLTLP